MLQQQRTFVRLLCRDNISVDKSTKLNVGKFFLLILFYFRTIQFCLASKIYAHVTSQRDQNPVHTSIQNLAILLLSSIRIGVLPLTPPPRVVMCFCFIPPPPLPLPAAAAACNCALRLLSCILQCLLPGHFSQIRKCLSFGDGRNSF